MPRESAFERSFLRSLFKVTIAELISIDGETARTKLADEIDAADKIANTVSNSKRVKPL